MTGLRKPSFDPRRSAQLREELVERAQLWLPKWRPRGQEPDFATALFSIAARLGSEVTQRLDRVPEKTFRGFLAWLGVRGQSARAARLPVVFSLTAKSEPLDASARVQLQATTKDATIGLETQDPLRIIPGSILQLIAADPEHDAYYVPPGIASLDAPKAEPSQWRVKSPASVGASRLQLESVLGLEPGMILSAANSGQHYRVVSVSKDGIVNIAPKLGDVEAKSWVVQSNPAQPAGLESGTTLTRVDVFRAFADELRNRQAHAIYLGAESALSVEIPALIEVVSDQPIPSPVRWEFWGLTPLKQAPEWVGLEAIVGSDGHTYLGKPAGTIVPMELTPGVSSRWIRAVRSDGVASKISGLRLRVNCDLKGQKKAIWSTLKNRLGLPSQDDLHTMMPAVEGIANTAPQVVSEPFFPLGRLPRLFDAFYLGSKEVLSKPSALVSLTFGIGEGFSGAVNVVRFARSQLVVGVGDDGRLRRLRHWDAAAGTPEITFLSSTAPPAIAGPPLRLNQRVRPGAALAGGCAHITVGVGKDVYHCWQTEVSDLEHWETYGEPGAELSSPDASETATSDDVGDTAVFADGNGFIAFALRRGRIFWTTSSAATRRWVSIQEDEKHIGERIVRIAPVLAAHKEASAPQELACVLENGTLLVLRFGKTSLGQVRATPTFSEVLALSLDPKEHPLDSETYPLVVRARDGHRLLFAATATPGEDGAPPVRRLIAVDIDDQNATLYSAPATLRGQSLSFILLDNAVAVTRDIAALAIVVDSDDVARLAVWDAFNDKELVLGDAPGTAVFVEGPVALGTQFLIPTSGGQVSLLSAVDALPPVPNLKIASALVFESKQDWSKFHHIFVELAPIASKDTSIGIVEVTHAILINEERGLWALERALDAQSVRSQVDVQVYGVLGGVAFVGDLVTPDQLVLAKEDVEEDVTAEDDYILLGGAIVQVLSIKGPREERTAVLSSHQHLRSLPVSIEYWTIKRSNYELTTAKQQPSIDISLLDEDLSRQLEQSELRFDGFVPRGQVPSHVLLQQERVLLPSPWTKWLNADSASFVVLQRLPFTSLRVFESSRSRNPELLWEYWNGTGWWRIPNVRDETMNLVKTGSVEFAVPADLKPTDVAGRTNHWVRARLVGGDFGQETVTLTSTPKDLGTVQTVVRGTEGIQAPYIISLEVAYEVCTPIAPDFVLTADSGSVRNQADINRLDGGTFELFVPLAQMLGHFESPVLGADGTVAAASGGRALYLGFSDELKGGPISLLFLVEDGDHEAAFPLRVDALIGDQFRAVVAQDQTRGLNETGLLSFTLTESSRPSELFGQSCHWIRLRPNANFDSLRWLPKIRAVYLNAVWASAAQTQACELLGSSDGSPNQRVKLARTPVLENTALLRVRELLGDEDVVWLRAEDRENVSDEISNRPGPWVRWEEVADFADRGPHERVYVLDHAQGEVCFGDGVHGMIPPIGPDCFLAERYSCGGGDEANAITAWSQIGLVTPLPGVERVVAPAAAAGGSNAQDLDTSLRFAAANLRARDRALTLRDFEQLTLQFSPDVAQVRAFARPARVQLVVIMRGHDPLPSKSTFRQLERYLLERVSPQLSFDLVPAELVGVRVIVGVTISNIEASGLVMSEVATRVARLLDAERGGLDGTGWPLGEVPSPADIAACLIGVKSLETVDLIELRRSSLTGGDEEVTVLRSFELLRPDTVQVDCQLSNAGAVT